jgi:hypothetical protein
MQKNDNNNPHTLHTQKSYKATQGVEFYQRQFSLRAGGGGERRGGRGAGRRVCTAALQLWDVGSTRSAEMAATYLHGAQALLVVYDAARAQVWWWVVLFCSACACCLVVCATAQRRAKKRAFVLADPLPPKKTIKDARARRRLARPAPWAVRRGLPALHRARRRQDRPAGGGGGVRGGRR